MITLCVLSEGASIFWIERSSGYSEYFVKDAIIIIRKCVFINSDIHLLLNDNFFPSI